MLEHVILHLTRQGVKRIVLLAGHLGDQFDAVVGRADALGADIDCFVEDEPAGTAGGLSRIVEVLDQEFLLLNGDTFFDIDYADLMAAAPPDAAWTAVMAVRALGEEERFGAVQMDQGRITRFQEKSGSAPFMNGGVYWVNRSIVGSIHAIPCSLERDILPELARTGLLWGREFGGLFVDIGTPEDFSRAQWLLSGRSEHPEFEAPGRE